MPLRTALDIPRAIRLYQDGHTLDQVGNLVGCCRQTLTKHLLRAGLELRRTGPYELPADTQEIIRLRDELRWSWRTIAQRVGLTISGARIRYRRAKLKTFRQHQEAVHDGKDVAGEDSPLRTTVASLAAAAGDSTTLGRPQPRPRKKRPMATREVVRLIDDLDGTEIEPGTRPVTFAFNGVEYEVDLTESNAAKLEDALRPFRDVARQTGGRRRPSTVPVAPTPIDPAQRAAMRTWARENGFTVSPRGRISQEIQAAYHAAQ